MDDSKRNLEDDPRTGAVMARRTFFSRALLGAGAAAALLGLTAAPVATVTTTVTTTATTRTMVRRILRLMPVGS